MPSLSEINQAICSAFPSESALHQAVFFAINKNLYEVAGQKALPYMVFDLVKWAECCGETDRLLQGLLNQNPGNLKLQKVCGQSPSPTTTAPTIREQEPAMDNNTQKISRVHLKGFQEHIEVALNCTEEQATAFLDELVEHDTTYLALANLDRDTIADAARTAVPGIKSTRIGGVVQLLKLFRADLRVSQKSRLLDIAYNPLTAQWERISGDTCQRDNSLFRSVEFPKPIVGWDDGKLYSSDAEFDANGNPLTASGIRDYLMKVRQSDLHPWISEAARNFPNLTLVDLVRYLRKSSCKTSIEVYNFLTSPQTTLAASQVAVEKIFQDSLRTTVSPSSSSEQSTVGASVMLPMLRKALAETYPHIADARRVAADAGLPVARIDFNGSSEGVWGEVLEEAKRHQKIFRLVQLAQEAYPSNPIFRNYR